MNSNNNWYQTASKLFAFYVNIHSAFCDEIKQCEKFTPR